MTKLAKAVCKLKILKKICYSQIDANRYIKKKTVCINNILCEFMLLSPNLNFCCQTKNILSTYEFCHFLFNVQLFG